MPLHLGCTLFLVHVSLPGCGTQPCARALGHSRLPCAFLQPPCLMCVTAVGQAVRPDKHAGQGAAEGAALVKDWSAAVEGGAGGSPLRLCVVEWLLLQDPLARAPPGRLLPAQRRPGLGVQRLLGELFTRMAQDCALDALVNRPLYFHNAVMYAAANNTFLNPHMEDCFRALCRGLCLGGRRPPGGAPAAHWTQEAGRERLGTQQPAEAERRASGAPGSSERAGGAGGGRGASWGEAGKGAQGAAGGAAEGAAGGGAAEGGGETAGGEAAVSLATLSHAINCGALRWGRGPPRVMRWTAQEQIAPISARARHFLASRAYQEGCVRASRVEMDEHLANVHALMHPAATPGSSPLLHGAPNSGQHSEPEVQHLPSMCRPSVGSEGVDCVPCQDASASSSSSPTYFVDWETEVEDIAAIQERLREAHHWYCTL